MNAIIPRMTTSILMNEQPLLTKRKDLGLYFKVKMTPGNRKQCFNHALVIPKFANNLQVSKWHIYIMNCTGLKTCLIFALKNVVKEIANYN